MKKCLIISFVLALSCKAQACGPEIHTHNQYLFSVEEPYDGSSAVDGKRFDAFWKQYTKGKVSSYNDWTDGKEASEIIMQTAQQRKDWEMVTYLKWLNSYLSLSNDYNNSWDYPTKEQINEREKNKQALLYAALKYRGKRLKPQFDLLVMRANMLLDRSKQNVYYWTQVGSKLPASPYKDMMENIYARALLRTGRVNEALEIYAKQGDMTSLKWYVRSYRNLAGIQTIYKRNPNSRLLPYLVQDFVNNAQETQDVYTRSLPYTPDADKAQWKDSDYVDAIQTVGRKPVYEKDMLGFIAFAKTVVSSGSSQTPCLWQSAIGALQYLLGQYGEAKATLAEAGNMQGTQRMKDNARVLTLLNSIETEPWSDNYSRYAAQEMQWLGTKYLQESASFRQADDYDQGSHYYDVLDRVAYNALYKRLQREDKPFEALALMAYMDEQYPRYEYYTGKKSHTIRYNEEWKGWETRADWSGEYFTQLDEMPADSISLYYNWLQSTKNDDALSAFLKAGSYRDAQYFNDVIGTKYMAEGRFRDAIPFLEKVPATYYNNTNTCNYMALRDYHKPMWFGKQRLTDAQQTMNERETVQTNPRLDFCREIVELKTQRMLTSNSDTADALGYKIATMLYQASYEGDCWWLTHYLWSCTDTVRPKEHDFIADAITLLQRNTLTEDKDLRFNSLYALAYIRRDPWRDTNYYLFNEDNNIIYRSSRQYQALMALNRFVNANPSYAENNYVSHCDVLKQFRKTL